MFKCKMCRADLHTAIIHRFADGLLTSQPGYECRRCWAMHDSDGKLLEDQKLPLAPDEDDEESDADTETDS